MLKPREFLICLAAYALLLFGATANAQESLFGGSQADSSKQIAIIPPTITEDTLPPLPLPTEIRDDSLNLTLIDLTADADDLWQRIRQGFAMPDLTGELVTDRQAYYLNRPDYITRIVERSRRYLYFIVGELERRGMPTELALLPMVESAFNPMALSSARASGLWQFIPATGKNYNLSQNWWYDQRRDIVASTNAALDYLQTIYEMHGDWHLALASYNWGEGAVARAIERNRQAGLPTDYSSLKMPAETRYYVPKLQALKNIIAQPYLYGINLPKIANRPYFATVKKPSGIDVALAARLAETPLDEFMALNPSYNRPVMPGGGDQSIVIPAEKVDVFRTNLDSHDQPLSSWTTRRLGRGESIDGLAARLGMSGSRLREVNGIPAGWRVPVGHALLVPASGAARLTLNDGDLPASTALAGRAAETSSVRQGKGHRKHSASGKHGRSSKAAVRHTSKGKSAGGKSRVVARR